MNRLTAVPPLPGHLPRPVSATPLTGGDIAAVWKVELADARKVIVKATTYDARLEAEGLDAIRRAGGPTPAVVAVDEHVLVIEQVAGPADLTALGRELATVHRRVGDRFGWRRDNVIGSLPQANPWTASWPAFYAEQRLAPYLGDLPPELAERLARAAEGPLVDLLDHDVAPSLVHGDLWNGNIVAGRWLVDPAVHHADRELDLAMLDLFGGVPDALQRGYDEVWPLDPGWERRRPALQLYHLLVHVRLFGTGYVSAVRSRLDQLGW
jgi:fructosamine-3-kinase